MSKFAATGPLADDLDCASLAKRRARDPRADGTPPGAWEGTLALAGERLHVSLIPLSRSEPGGPFAVVVQARSTLEQRRIILVGLIACAALLAGLASALMGRVLARTWRRHLVDEVRHLLGLEAPAAAREGALEHPDFGPLAQDLRHLLRQLDSERAALTGGTWTPERLKRTVSTLLPGEHLMVIANREPYLHEKSDHGSVLVVRPASGLVTALEPVLRTCSGTWIAHGSGSADRDVVDRHDRIRVPPGEESYALRRVWLSAEEEAGYYYGMANEGLWPLCHVAHERPAFRVADWELYCKVNERFAEVAVQETSTRSPVVLVQDYHFAVLPRLLRAKLPAATIVTFWHVPWPNAERFGIAPWCRELLDGLLGSSILGFHTQQHCNNFLDSVDRYLEARIDRDAFTVTRNGHVTAVRAYPISVEWPYERGAGAPPPEACRRDLLEELGLPADVKLLVGVDRIDYTKGLVERLLALERLLEIEPRWIGKVVFVQAAAPSRTAIASYRSLGEELERQAARINLRFSRGGAPPLLFRRRHHDASEVLRLMRAADACYVSSLHDGMNLVAKEFIAARDDEQGVLVLSSFTGAARELPEALLVNPYDVDASARALRTALTMPAEEQRRRMRAMRAHVAEFNIYRWAGRMLTDAARHRDRVTMEVSIPGTLAS